MSHLRIVIRLQVSDYEVKVNAMKSDIKKLQDFNCAVKADLERYEQQVSAMHEELQSQSERNRQAVDELTRKVRLVPHSLYKTLQISNVIQHHLLY